ncbi:unnamed protein product [Paramecium pentaurelia]|uniref:Uncharacterized protein n=1 Tax=Paramecium pentaurelia TaxID=43138 RepID=A0A8S1SFX1_9CILI|nr:unnamed protein product [Paramecium pentaurelia]
MIKKIKQERVEQQSSNLDNQQKQQDGESKVDCLLKKSENCELKTNTNIYNLQYQKIMEQIKQIYQEQSTTQATKNSSKVEQMKLKKDKTVSKIVRKTRKELVQQKSMNQTKMKTKQESEDKKDRINNIQMHFTQITTTFLSKLKSEFEKVEMDLLALLNN